MYDIAALEKSIVQIPKHLGAASVHLIFNIRTPSFTNTETLKENEKYKIWG